MTSIYLLEKIVRHGAAIERLKKELLTSTEEMGNHGEIPAIAFDAADFVWSFLVTQGYQEAEETREIRNHVAQEIIKVLESYEWLLNKPQ